MARSRTIVIAGAGIGGLTTALAVARKGFRVVVLDSAARLEETGAGIQLSPNATRVLAALGVLEKLSSLIVAPEAIRIVTARGREIVRVPLGRVADYFYGAPYYVVHRADLQNVLESAARANPDIALHLGARAEDYAEHANGITVQVRTATAVYDEYGLALVGADGLWSTLRTRLGDRRAPRFARRTAWRATISADDVAPEFREALISLWLGPNAHLVHYPVSASRLVNIVAIVRDNWTAQGWSAPGAREELLKRFSSWDPGVRTLLAAPERWLKWALCDRAPLRRWGKGVVTLLGDAAHPMLPFMAQGAAIAIEDAYVLAECLKDSPEPAAAFRKYENLRSQRVARVQRRALRNGRIFHFRGVNALVRNVALRAIGGEGLLRRHDWVYNWRP